MRLPQALEVQLFIQLDGPELWARRNCQHGFVSILFSGIKQCLNEPLPNAKSPERGVHRESAHFDLSLTGSLKLRQVNNDLTNRIQLHSINVWP